MSSGSTASLQPGAELAMPRQAGKTTAEAAEEIAKFLGRGRPISGEYGVGQWGGPPKTSEEMARIVRESAEKRAKIVAAKQAAAAAARRATPRLSSMIARAGGKALGVAGGPVGVLADLLLSPAGAEPYSDDEKIAQWRESERKGIEDETGMRLAIGEPEIPTEATVSAGEPWFPEGADQRVKVVVGEPELYGDEDDEYRRGLLAKVSEAAPGKAEDYADIPTEDLETLYDVIGPATPKRKPSLKELLASHPMMRALDEVFPGEEVAVVPRRAKR